MSSTLARAFIQERGLQFGNREQAAEYAALAKKLDEEALANWDSPEWHREMAQDLSDNLTYGFTNVNPFGSYVDTRNVGEFDRNILKETRGLKVFFTARGGEVDESQLTTQSWEVPKDDLGFHVSEFEDNVRSGFSESLASVAAQAETRLRAEQYRRWLTLMQTAVPSGSPFYTSAVGIAKATLDANIRAVKEAVKPDGVVNVPVTIVGRAPVTDQISDFAGFAPEALEEIRRTGMLGTYKGCNVVTLSHFVDEDDNNYMPANELWIFGGQAGRFVNFGGLRTKEWTENTVDYWHVRGTIKIGGLIHHPEQTRRMIDSNITP